MAHVTSWEMASSAAAVEQLAKAASAMSGIGHSERRFISLKAASVATAIPDHPKLSALHITSAEELLDLSKAVNSLSYAGSLLYYASCEQESHTVFAKAASISTHIPDSWHQGLESDGSCVVCGAPQEEEKSAIYFLSKLSATLEIKEKVEQQLADLGYRLPEDITSAELRGRLESGLGSKGNNEH